MMAADRDAAGRRQRAQTIALWRWSLIEPAMDAALTSRQRGAMVRALAAGEHAGPHGGTVSVSRKTIDRWITARRAGGFDALVPAPRQSAPRTDPQVVELAAGLKKENPARTAAQVRRVLAAQLGWAPSERALQRWFEARELTTRPGGQPPEAFGRDHRRPFPVPDRAPVRPPAGRGPVRRRAARRDRRPWHPGGLVYRQRVLFCRCLAGPHLRGAGHHADPQPARAADGQRQDRKGLRDYPAAVPGRGHRRHRRPGPAPGRGP